VVQELKKINNDVAAFLALVTPYCKSKIPSGDSIGIILKDEVVSDPDKLIELQIEAKKIGAKCTTTPPGFRIPLSVALSNTENVDSYMLLHIDDFEEGGPQPRTKITPNDPETVKLYESIEAKGQIDPIKVFPSPINPDKKRIFDGHRRYLVIFKMLMQTTIKAVCVHISEQEAHEDAFLLNDIRQNISAYDKGHYIFEVLMKRFSYLNQEALAKKLGISRQSLNQMVLAYNEVQTLQPKVSPEIDARASELPERTLRAIRLQVPEDLKPKTMEEIINKNLSVRDTEKLCNDIKATPNADTAAVGAFADQIVEEKASKGNEKSLEEKAELFFKEGDQAQRKNDRFIDKLIVDFGNYYPDSLIKAVYGQFGDAKVTPEKFQSTIRLVVEIMANRCEKDLDSIFAEASGWR
jgi:ParB family chromosome partitioning protein